MLHLDIQKTLHGNLGAMELSISFSVKEHEFVAISGPSGSGKTTLLRILAGLEEASGTIEVDGTKWLDKDFSLPPQKRGIGFVFQDYALFANMSVLENLLFVKKDKALASHLLKITELTELSHRMPNSLSGGQKQRVALCRAFMRRPKLLLMDEPLSALDPLMRKKLQHDILTLHKEFGTTSIMVSHDPSEIYTLASRVIELKYGKIIQDTSPKEKLLKTKGAQQFSLRGELLDIQLSDDIYIAVVAIGEQIVEVALEKENKFQIGEQVQILIKEFGPALSKIERV